MSDDLSVDVFWSMRSPYCYLALDRILETQADRTARFELRPVRPLAIRNPAFFEGMAQSRPHYRTYQLLDAARTARYLKIAYGRPRPDPVVQDLKTHEIAEEQPHIARLTRLAQAAALIGQGWDFLDSVMRLLWDGTVDGWDKNDNLPQAIADIGMDPRALESQVAQHASALDDIVARNEADQDAAGHHGVPLFVFRGEPFFGQDRFDQLIWRLEQRGLTRRD